MNRFVRYMAKWIFESSFKIIKGKPRLFAYQIAMRVVDRLLGQNYYDWHTNGEKYFLQCLSSLMPFGSVFDVGAHHGDWARIALSAGQYWFIYCFEPNPSTYKELENTGLPKERCNLNNFGFSGKDKKVEIINYRVKGKEGDFVSSPMSSIFCRESLMNSEPLSVESKVPIALKTIDMFCRSRKITEITLLKIDTERNEFRILQGATDIIATGKVASIQFEYDSSWIDSKTFLFDVWRFLQQYDYKIYKIASEGLIQIARYSPGLENFRFSNFVALNAAYTWPRERICMVI